MLGCNGNAELGIGCRSNGDINVGCVNPQTDYGTPQQVVGISGGATSLSTGNYHTCAIVDGGSYCWGQGNLWVSAVQMTGFDGNVMSVSAGADFTCATTEAGSAYCWGQDTCGNLGLGYVPDVDGNGNITTPGQSGNVNNPQLVPGLSGAMTISVGLTDTACAIDKAGNMSCWGDNSQGQFGNGAADLTVYATPVASGLAVAN